MKKRIISSGQFVGRTILIFFFCFFLFLANAYGCPSSSGAEIGVTGVLKIEIYAGAPNYESIVKGDKPEKYWFVVSSKSVCFSPDGEFLKEEAVLVKIQLILDGFEGQLKEGGKYFVQGVTVPAHTGYHHSDVLLHVTSVKAL
jgi:hypothetical protein